MSRKVLGIWFVLMGFVLFTVLLPSCTRRPDRGITPDEAKEMILHFLSSDDDATTSDWIADSRTIVEKEKPSHMPNGTIFVGPWVVDPAKQTVQLAIDRAQLDGSYRKVDNRYVIGDVSIMHIRGRGEREE